MAKAAAAAAVAEARTRLVKEAYALAVAVVVRNGGPAVSRVGAAETAAPVGGSALDDPPTCGLTETECLPPSLTAEPDRLAEAERGRGHSGAAVVAAGGEAAEAGGGQAARSSPSTPLEMRKVAVVGELGGQTCQSGRRSGRPKGEGTRDRRGESRRNSQEVNDSSKRAQEQECAEQECTDRAEAAGH